MSYDMYSSGSGSKPKARTDADGSASGKKENTTARENTSKLKADVHTTVSKIADAAKKTPVGKAVAAVATTLKNAPSNADAGKTAKQIADEDNAKRNGKSGSSNTAQAAPVAPAAPTAPAAPVDASAGTSYQGASDQMKAYDQYAQQALGKSPAEAMQMAQAAAAQQAQSVSDQAVQQAAKGARTSGAMGGQAALAATGQAANAYGQAQQAGQQQYFNTAQLGAQLGSEMSGRLQNKEADATQRYGIDKGYDAAKLAAKSASDANKKGWFDSFMGGAGGLAALWAAGSDKNFKTDIKETNFSDGLAKLKSYSYNYKPGEKDFRGKPEAGIIAQDLEKTAMKPAVINAPDGKYIDTKRLSTMNTGALSEHEKRLQNIEKMVGNLKSYKKPGAK